MATRGSVAISEGFGDLLDPRFAKIYSQTKERITPSMIPLLFGSPNVGKHSFYKTSGMGAMADLEDFDGAIPYDTFSQLYDKTFEFPEKALGFKVERKLSDDEEFGIMDRRPEQLSISVARTREKKGAGIFTNAFVGTDGPDSLSLCNDSHPFSPDDATTQDNKGTSALSPVSVEATRRIGFTSILTDRGDLAEIDYDLILCSIDNQEKAWEIIESTGKVDTANNNRNFHQGRYKLAMWPRLRGANWFMLDAQLAKMHLLFMDRVKGSFNYDRDFDTLIAKWSVYERYEAGWSDWRPVYGHLVS